MYLLRTSWLLQKTSPRGLRWEEPGGENAKVYLTFDDGPHPQATPFVLRLLEQYGAKGTFFCIGNNVAAWPEIYAATIAAGHAIGNHTHNHLNGWKTDTKAYLADVATAAGLISSRLFRPPYGRIRPAQARELQRLGYQVCMWSLLSADFDTTISAKQCLENVVFRIRPGDIVVFHDSAKAWPRLEHALPGVLEHCRQQGWECASLALR